MILFIGINGPHCEKSCLRGFANTTGADQPAHPRSLISAFVVRFFFRLNLALTELPEDRFSRDEANIILPSTDFYTDTSSSADCRF